MRAAGWHETKVRRAVGVQFEPNSLERTSLPIVSQQAAGRSIKSGRTLGNDPRPETRTPNKSHGHPLLSQHLICITVLASLSVVACRSCWCLLVVESDNEAGISFYLLSGHIVCSMSVCQPD